ncbi:MAG TPA: sigma-70 family RNA polymerase sigma factor [Opitutaceae bacterium]|jgi:RNA polymerase sigma factor (sigma-70 family)
MRTDSQLLEDFVSRHDQPAFAEFVQRHSGLVYHVALRSLNGDRHRAEDATASVFADVAHKANRLRAHPAIAGWLHTAARFAAGKIARSESNRQRQEKEAAQLNEIDGPTPAAWNQLSPFIDSALRRLNEADRTAVLLRYFEGQSHGAIAAALHLSDDAARMRVDRALEKLRGHLLKLGVGSLSAALEQTLAAHALQPAPAVFPSWLVGRALAQAAVKPAAAGASGLTAALPVATAVISAALILTLGGAAWSWKQAHDSEQRIVLAQHSVEEADARTRNSQLALADSAKIANDLKAGLSRLQDIDKQRRLERTREERAAREFANWDPQAEGKKFMQRHPEVRAALDAYYSGRFAWEYGSILDLLHLTPHQEAALLDLTDRGRGMGTTAAGSAYFAGKQMMFMGADGATTPAQINQAVGQILTPEQSSVFLARWNAANASLVADDMASAVWDSATPLSAEQAAKLVQSLQNPTSAASPASFLSPDQMTALQWAKEEHSYVYH